MRDSKVDAAAKSDLGKSRRKLDRRHTLEIPQLNTQKSLRNALQEVKLVHVRTFVHLGVLNNWA
jgi:hypothetical protein